MCKEVSLVSQLVKNLQCRRHWFKFWVTKIAWRRDRLPTIVFFGLPGGSYGKESTCNVGDLGSIPGLGRSPGEGNGNPLQYSCLEHPHGQRSLVSYSPWGYKESDMTEQHNVQHSTMCRESILCHMELLNQTQWGRYWISSRLMSKICSRGTQFRLPILSMKT